MTPNEQQELEELEEEMLPDPPSLDALRATLAQLTFVPVPAAWKEVLEKVRKKLKEPRSRIF